MELNLITSTQIQKNAKRIFGRKPIQIVLSKNKLQGILLSAEVSEHILKSGLLEQLQEELYELKDKETVETINKYRNKEAKPIALADFRQKYGV